MKKSVKINNRVARISFWYTLHEHFLAFEGLLEPARALTSEDKAILKEIHRLVYCAYQLTKERKNKNENF